MVAVAGNIDHDEVVALVREHFGPRLVRGRTAVPPRKGTGRVTGPAVVCSWSTGTPSRPICRWACGRRAGTGSIGGRCRCSTPRSAVA